MILCEINFKPDTGPKKILQNGTGAYSWLVFNVVLLIETYHRILNRALLETITYKRKFLTALEPMQHQLYL